MIDTHCHLDFKEFNKDRDEVIKKAKENLTALINSGTSFEGNIKALKLSKDYNNFIHPSFGFHPLQSANMNDEDVDKVLSQINKHIDEIVAIGEVGMDFFYVKDKLQRNRQLDIFKKFCDFANEHQNPILIHCRDAEKKAFNIVNQFKDIPKVIFHCYSGSLKTAKKIEDMGYFMSASTMIDYSKNHQELFSKIPLENILTETDSPYLHPVRGKRNEPSIVKLTISKIAEIKEIDFSVVDKVTENNAKEVFNI
ncbi:MAG: TatD family hydrolase [Methanobrevibacter sp.]|jgi:TatD DNase family protein|nr:TatD family hydrolase [Candidatus Methanovirga basalitermitum]